MERDTWGPASQWAERQSSRGYWFCLIALVGIALASAIL